MITCDSSHLLERLVLRETAEEIRQLLTDKEKEVVDLSIEGMTDAEIARSLGLRRSTIHMRLLCARRRIERELPEAAPLAAGRRRRR